MHLYMHIFIICAYIVYVKYIYTNVCISVYISMYMYISEGRSVMSYSLWPHGLYSPWTSPVQNTAVGGLSLLQGLFPSQELNPGLPHCRWILHQLSHRGSPYMYIYVYICIFVCAYQCVYVHCCHCLITKLCLCNPMDCSPPGSSVQRDFPGKNPEVGGHCLLQGIFLNQRSNLWLLSHLMHWRQILYCWAIKEAFICVYIFSKLW